MVREEKRRGGRMTEGFRHGYADLGKVTLHYVSAGAGLAVVRIHG